MKDFIQKVVAQGKESYLRETVEKQRVIGQLDNLRRQLELAGCLWKSLFISSLIEAEDKYSTDQLKAYFKGYNSGMRRMQLKAA